MSTFTPKQITRTLSHYRYETFIALCKTFALYRNGKKSGNPGATWKQFREIYQNFNGLAEDLNNYVLDYVKTSDKESVPALYANLNMVEQQVQEWTSYDSVQKILDKINREAKRLGAVEEDYVDLESGEVLSELTGPTGVAYIPIQSPYFYHALFRLSTQQILKTLQTHIRYYQEGKNINRIRFPEAGSKLDEIRYDAEIIAKAVQKEKQRARYSEPLTINCENKVEAMNRLEKCYRELTVGQKVPFIKTGLGVFKEVFTSSKPKDKAKILWAHTNAELDFFLDAITPALKNKDNIKVRGACYFLKYNPDTENVTPFTSDKIRNHRVKKEKIPNRNTLHIAASHLFDD
jgi:hypothetical protein